jgi:phosphoglycerol transferase
MMTAKPFSRRMHPLRLWAATLLFVIVLGAALAVAALPWLRPDKYGMGALLALMLGLLVAGRAAWRRSGKTYLVVLVAAALLIPAVIIARGFGRIDMLSIAFHADFGMQGATLEGLHSEILAALLSSGLIALSLFLLAGLWRFGVRFHSFAALALIALNPFAQFAAAYALTPAVQSDLASKLQDPILTQGGENPDLLVIYLEGTDRQFADKAVWGDLYAPLGALADEGISLTGVTQIAGTGWSLAGMVASQCGVPLLPRGLISRNNFDAVERFLPAITCLGDVLAKRGYRSAYVVGGDLAFGGIDRFYGTHQISDQTGFHEQRALYPHDDYEAATIDWILDDQMVLETARQKWREMLQQEGPMAMIVETIGPHGRLGYLSRHCSPSGRGEKSRDARAVLDCTIKDTAAFVNFIRESHAAARPGKGLRLVILSDHLSHNGSTPETAPGFKGLNTAILLGGEKGQVIERPGAMIDIYPTMLHWLGWSEAPHAAGLGRSLLAEGKTLTAEKGVDRLDAMLVSDGALAAGVWADP